MDRFFCHDLLLVCVLLFVATVTQAAEGPMVRISERIRAQQTDDGAIAMSRLPAKDVPVVPYFANFAALGLVSAYQVTGDAHCLEAAKRWADWYALHQNPDGTVNDYHGSPGAWKPTGDYDSTDSYAATYLELLWAIQRASFDTTWLRHKADALRLAVAAIRLTLQPNGLTLAKPSWPVMYAMDNTETARGLHAAARIASTLNLATLARETLAMAKRMEEAAARDLWDSARFSYYIGIQPDGGKMEGLQHWYPDIMANLMAIAWLPGSERNRELYVRLKTRFGNDLPLQVRNKDDLDRLVWWGWAAQGAGDQALLSTIRKRFDTIDATAAALDNPGLLGSVCRLLGPP